MKIQLNTDVHIEGTEALAAQVGATVEQALERFSEHITRVEVHLSEENGDKKGGNGGQPDQRCMLEARLEGRQPVAVTDHAATLEQAVQGAAQKLARLLDTTLGRLHDHREKTSGLPLSGTDPKNWSDSPVE
ncbi:MAG: HPF/RaiA family ribosome-associated protein [Burkholderiaceae bacterium]